VAHRFAEFLAETGQRWWQVLPLGPTGATKSPYQSHSSFAGNPLLISPEGMVERGWLDPSDLPDRPAFPAERVDFIRVARLKRRLLRRAFEKSSRDEPDFQEFLAANADWLDDYALYMALKEHSGGLPWFEWERGLAARKAAALSRWRDKLAEAVHYHQFVQYVFDSQWKALRQACSDRSIGLIGDIPIFVAHDSADVWTRPDLFFLDKRGRPTCVAGVPPDLFSRTGQLWGNPLYRWQAHEEEAFAWWIHRLTILLKQVDMIRIDHFRGLEAYWEVPGKARTAAKGRWVPGPGASFFRALQRRFADLPFIAEDLGLITPAVERLRDEFELPGMRVLQFGFDPSPDQDYHLPHRYVSHCLVYTATHDNDTARGWLDTAHVDSTQSAGQVRAERAYALRYLDSDGEQFHWDMIRLALASVAAVAIIPMQDILGLGSEARMNIPGKAKGNWGWRFLADQLTAGVKAHLAELTSIYRRWNGTPPERFDPRHLARAAGAAAASDNSKAERKPRVHAVERPRARKESQQRNGPARGTSGGPRGGGPRTAKARKGKSGSSG
jgi:4-alpha-glucanotransferase